MVGDTGVAKRFHISFGYCLITKASSVRLKLGLKEGLTMTTRSDPRWQVEAGRKGGRSRSPKKLAAVRENARRGGRPRGVLVETSRDVAPPLHVTFDRATSTLLAAELLKGSTPRVRLTIHPWPTKRARIYVDGIGPKNMVRKA